MKVQDLNGCGGIGDEASLRSPGRFALGTSFVGIFLNRRVQKLGISNRPRIIMLVWYVSWAEAVGER